MSELNSRFKTTLAGKNVALVCDWLTTIGGAERVVKSLHDLFPDAPIYTSQYNAKVLNWFDNADVRTGWLQKLPHALRKFLPFLRMRYFSSLDLNEYDVVISATGAEAKAVRTNSKQLNICYMHAPTQYYWGLYDRYMQDPGFGVLNPLVRLVLRLTVGTLRKFDYKYAQRADILVANSTYIQSEIKRFYKRDSLTIFPPVDTESFALQKLKRDYFIITSRHVPWKRVDLAIAACAAISKRLLVVGEGTETEALKKLAAALDPSGSLIEFVPTISDTRELAKLVGLAKAFIFPSLEPFGIAPIEALATGTPVIAYRAGGALDFVEDGENGLYFNSQTRDLLADAIDRFGMLSTAGRFEPSRVSETAQRFSDQAFKRAIMQVVVENLEKRVPAN